MKKILLIFSFSLFCLFAKAQYVTIYGFYNTINGKHFYSINSNEVPVGSGGWVRDANLNRLYAYPGSGAPVYRYYNSSTGAHFYSVGSAPSGFTLEGIMGCEPGSPQYGYAQQQNVYGYYNTSSHDYYYSFSSTPPAGWTAIGAQFTTFP